MMLTERQLFILQKIIELYSVTGEPVGSRALVDNYDLKVSSATIRNEMSRLEEMGLLEKTHSSSGRIPSVEGYRFYVGNLMRPKAPNALDKQKITDFIQSSSHSLDELFDQTASLLSKLTNYTVILLGPQSDENNLTDLEIVSVGSNQYLMVMEFDQIDVKSHLFKWPETIEENNLLILKKVLKEHLVGQSLQEVQRVLQEELPQVIDEIIVHQYEQRLFSIVKALINEQKGDYVYVSGKNNILDFIEEIDANKIRDIFGVLDDENHLKSLLLPLDQEVNIKIGTKLPNKLYDDLSMMTTAYHLGDNRKGMIAVLGPTRMAYDLTLGTMKYFQKELTEKLLKDYFNNEE